MNNHTTKNSGRTGMRWMIILGLLLLGVLLLGGGKFFSTGYIWQILIGIFVVAHVWMMFKGHGGHDGRTDNAAHDGSAEKSDISLAKQPDAKNEHKHGGCCH